MTYPFRMYGRIIQVYRYKAVYMERQPGEDGEMTEVEMTSFFPTETEAQRTGGTVTALDATEYEWLDGLEMPDVPDTYAEAIKVYEMGEEAYREQAEQLPTDERVAALEEAVAMVDETAIDLYETQLQQEETNAAQDEALIELYEMIGG